MIFFFWKTIHRWSYIALLYDWESTYGMHLWPFNHHLFRFTSHVGTKSAVGTWITSWHPICVCCAFLRWFFVRISALWSCGSCKPLPGLSGIATYKPTMFEFLNQPLFSFLQGFCGSMDEPTHSVSVHRPTIGAVATCEVHTVYLCRPCNFYLPGSGK